MRKIILISLFIFLFLLISGCGNVGTTALEPTPISNPNTTASTSYVKDDVSVEPTASPSATPTLVPTLAPTMPPNDENTTSIDNDAASENAVIEDEADSMVSVSVNECVIYDDGGIKITLKSLDTNKWDEQELKLLIENESGRNKTIQARDESINGIMISSTISASVASGKKSNAGMTFKPKYLTKYGIEVISEIEFKLRIIDDDDRKLSFNTDPISIYTSAYPNHVQVYDDSGYTAYDKKGFKVVVKKISDNDSFWGSELSAYIENNSGYDATMQLRDVSVNGFMVDPIFSCNIVNGKKAYDNITFRKSEFEDNGIKDIDDIELVFRFINDVSRDGSFNSEKINIEF